MKEAESGKVIETGHSGAGAMLIAGPCSAESEIQVMETAKALAKSGISYFRAGVWKPRTQPGSFEGAGLPALEWLRKARTATGVPVAIEVANAQHVAMALDHEIDLLWIGARSSVNPFTVQEIADALRGKKVPVMVKNPVNPDVDLWSGAIRRLQDAGLEEIIACHRGFNVYGKSTLRNLPLWEIPIEFKRRFPDIRLICDPSHISGSRKYIQKVAQKALDLGFEGLMVEVHREPEKALSDAKQQLTPDHFIRLIGELRFHIKSTGNTDYHNRIRSLREEIDDLDERLLEILSQRNRITRQIGYLKKENNLPFYQYDRWTDILENCRRLSSELDLNEEYIAKLFSLIHLESIDVQGE